MKPDKPSTLFGIQIRLDATLCGPGELWLEDPQGRAELIWSRVEQHERKTGWCWYWTFEPPFKSKCGICAKCQDDKRRSEA